MAATYWNHLWNIMSRNIFGDILLHWLFICTPCGLQTVLRLPKQRAKNHQEKSKHTGEKGKFGRCQGQSAVLFPDWKWKASCILQNMKLQLQEQIVAITPYIILLGDTINSSAKLLKFKYYLLRNWCFNHNQRLPTGPRFPHCFGCCANL